MGVGIDLLPLVILLFLLVQRMSRTEEQLAREEVMSRSVRDLLLESAAQELLRAPGVVDQNAVRGAIDQAFGRSPPAEQPAEDRP